jgi:cytochrome c oxidase subunit I+III
VPEGIVRLPGPSVLPLVAAFSLMVVFAAELYNFHPLAIGAGIVMTLAVIAWMWPPPIERERRLDDAGRRTIHGLPVYLSGPRAPGWWGMTFILLVMAVGSACLIFSYYYLQLRNPEWPPSVTPRPSLGLPLLEAVVLGACALTTFVALRGVRANRQGVLLIGITGTVLLAIAYLVLQGVEFTQWGFTPDVNAYTSAFGTLVGLQAAFVFVGLIITTVVMLQSWLGYFDSWRHLAVENVRNYWWFVCAHWLVLIIVLFIA